MKNTIAKDLLKIQAVFLRPDEPFTWASGIKSPIYCDNRLTLSDHQVRTDVESGLAALVKEHYPEAEVLMGTSTAGIAHAAITAQMLELPMGYVRSGAKDHGRKNQIEGKLPHRPVTKVLRLSPLFVLPPSMPSFSWIPPRLVLLRKPPHQQQEPTGK